MNQPKKLTSIIEYNIRYNFKPSQLLELLSNKHKEIHLLIKDFQNKINEKQKDIDYIRGHPNMKSKHYERRILSYEKLIKYYYDDEIVLHKKYNNVTDEIYEILHYYSLLP